MQISCKVKESIIFIWENLQKEKKTEWKWEARKRSLKTRGFQPLFEISAVMWSIKYVVS